MKNIQLHILFIFFGVFFGNSSVSIAQEKQQDSLAIAKQEVNQDNLGNVTDKFQEYFFQALAQRGIENYEKAVTALLQCEELKPNNSAVFYELGKNYKDLEEYTKAEDYLYKALDEKQGNQDILTELYDVYYLTQNYPEAIKIAKQLSKFNIDYYEDIANLYVRTQQYSEALKALDYIDSREGKSEYRDALRAKIFSETEDASLEENYLKEELAKYPNDTDSYLALMYFYAKQNQLEKTYQVAEQLLEVYPNAQEAHYALYKKYLANYEDDKAVNSMKTVLKGDLNETMKKEVVKDFMQLVKEKPKYEQDLMQTLDSELGEDGETNKQMASFYVGKDNKKAILRLQAALQENPTDFTTAKDLMLLYIEEKMPSKAILLAEEFMATYPSQPILYLVTGVANNTLENFNKAEENLSMGLDYLIDNPKMESDFYQQLSIAYQGLGNDKEAKKFQQKFENIQKTL